MPIYRGREVTGFAQDDSGVDIALSDGQSLRAEYYDGAWELPALEAVTAPTAVLIRPDGHVAWVGNRTQRGLADALATWFGASTAT